MPGGTALRVLGLHLPFDAAMLADFGAFCLSTLSFFWVLPKFGQNGCRSCEQCFRFCQIPQYGVGTFREVHGSLLPQNRPAQ